MKIWIDMTASAHVLVFRPLIAIMEARGDEVQITAREYAQTLQLLELHGLQAEVIGRHGGRSRVQKARQMTHRLGALKKWAKGREFDVALMNPPWSDGKAADHIIHALKFAPIVVALAPLATLEGFDRKQRLWDPFHLRAMRVCSSRPAFGEEGGKMPVACFEISRDFEPADPSDDGLHETTVGFWP